jgi:hypothetical protein
MRLRLALSIALACASTAARADRRDLYVAASAGPAVVSLHDSLAGTTTTSAPAFAASGAAWYGLTHTLHVGLAASATLATNATFPGTTTHLPDGTPATGTLASNLGAFGLAALCRYRRDTGWRLAPWAQLDLGISATRFSSQELSSSAGAITALPAATRAEGVARLGLGLEYRLKRGLLLSAGIVAGIATGPRPYQFEVPLLIGWVL